MFKWMCYLSFIVYLVAVTRTNAQDKEYEEWLKKEQGKLKDYLSEQDRKFSEFLKMEWKQTVSEKPVEAKKKPKPSVLPKEVKTETQKPSDKTQGDSKPVQKNVDETKVEKPKSSDKIPKESVKPEVKKETIVDKKPDTKKTEVKELPKVVEKPVTEVVKPSNEVIKKIEVVAVAPVEKIAEHKPVNTVPTESKVAEQKSVPKESVSVPVLAITSSAVSFREFGVDFGFPKQSKAVVHIKGEVDNKSIAKFYEDMCVSDYAPMLEAAKKQKQNLNLNDWGYGKMIYDLAVKIYGQDENEANLFTWFMLLKSGYRTRVSYTKTKVFLLVSSDGKIFGSPYFKVGGSDNPLYIIAYNNLGVKKAVDVYLYTQDLPEAKQSFNFSTLMLPKFGGKISERDIKFTFRGKAHTYKTDYDSSLSAFFEYFPQSEMPLYFTTEPSPQVKNSLLPQLKKDIEGLNERDKVSFLLAFVQQATDYKTDPENFGREKPMFVEESIRYEFSDCEDRAVLFAYLVKKLVGLEVIGLDYPDHISTAVKFSAPLQNADFVEFKNVKYFICDATYIGADIGACMPDYKGVVPNIISF